MLKLNARNYFQEGINCLAEEQYMRAYETFQEGLQALNNISSAGEGETTGYKHFFAGMIHYENAPKNSTLNPLEYLQALENYISAAENGLEHYYLYYYLGDAAAKIGIAGKHSPFHPVVRYLYQSFAIQSFVLSTNILAKLDPKGALAKRALHKATSLYTYHHKDAKQLTDAKNITSIFTEDVLTGKTACSKEEWHAFLLFMRKFLDPRTIPKPPRKMLL